MMNKGIIQLIVIFVALILLVSALKINLRGYIDTSSEQALKSNTNLIIETAKLIWTNYIEKPLKVFWNDYVIPFITGQFLSGLKFKIQQGTTLPASQ